MGNLAEGQLELRLACTRAPLEALADGADPDGSLAVDK